MVNHTTGNNNHPRITFFILIAVVLVIALFGDSLFSYFFQDDWYSLLISNAKNYSDLVGFFKPIRGLVYYRPLGMQIPFFVFQKIFGIHPLPFRLAVFTIHFINGFLVYKIMRLIAKNTYAAIGGSLLYLTSAVHATVFYWAATIAFALAPLYYFWSILLFLNKKAKWSFVVFFFGMLTNELVITLPVSLVLLSLFINKKIKTKEIIPFFVLSGLYGLFRVFAFSLPSDSSYHVSLSIKQLLINFRNYFLWAINWPETAGEQFKSIFLLSDQFVNDFAWILPAIYLILCMFIFLFVYIGYVFLKNKSKLSIRVVIFCFGWFIVTISPVLFFSQHAYTYYLPISLFGVIFFIMFALMQLSKNIEYDTVRMVIVLIFCSWIYASLVTMRVYRLTHWAPRRATNAQKLITEIQKENSNVSNNTEIYVTLSSENMWALGDQNALKVVFNNTTITTVYNE